MHSNWKVLCACAILKNDISHSEIVTDLLATG